MTKDLDSAEGLAMRPVADGGRFDQASVALHWLTVLLIIGQFTSAWLREAVDHETSLAVAILATHRTMGVLTWIVGLVRLVWRHNFAYLPPFPESMPKLQQSIAKANEYGLYALLVLQPITGLARGLFGDKPFELLIWQVPALEPNPVPSISCPERFMSSAPRRCSLSSDCTRAPRSSTVWSCVTACCSGCRREPRGETGHANPRPT